MVIPVHNEEVDLEASVRRLHRHLESALPYSFRITIADNASTDATLGIALNLAGQLPHVRVRHLAEKGRGRALRAVWSSSDAQVFAYMDVDLSTDLAALLPLVAPLVSGHSDLAVGTRLAHGSRVVRGAKRELISRTYNVLIRRTLATRFSDAQCGFKAIRADVAARLLPLVEDSGWFFDTELLVLAGRSGLRIHTFGVLGRRGVARHQAQGLVVFALGLALTSGSLAALQTVVAAAARWVEISVLVVANLAATLLRFLLLRGWVFSHAAGDRLPKQAEREQAAGRQPEDGDDGRHPAFRLGKT